MAKIDPPASDQSPPIHPDSDPCLDSVSDLEQQRTRIRQRWELASALNFLHVFKDVIGNELKISGEEIENGLITPNDDLAKVHIALLKGIPPVNKNMTNGDAWVSIVCKKLVTWWPWVAEGDIPLEADQGKEIQIYKTFDPTNRVMILKALCEVRAQQDDVVRYIADELKKGTNITTFRKEKIGSVSNAVSYWYDKDSVMGHRLYKEVSQVESKTVPKGKERTTQLTQPRSNYQWETVATELDEFLKLSDDLSSSEVNAEIALSDIIKTDIVPVLQDIQKKKEQALKRQQNKALQLNRLNNILINQVGLTRSCRERRPVRYTFDEFDRAIDEAIHLSKKLKTTRSNKENVKQVENVSEQKDDSDKSDSEPEEIHDNHTDDDDDADYDENEDSTKHISGNDDDFNEKNNDNEEEEEDEEEEEEEDTDQDSSRKDQEKEFSKTNNGYKKKFRQRLTRNSARVVSDSDVSSQEIEKLTETSSDSEKEDSGEATKN